MSTHQFLITIALVFATLIGKADVIVFDDQTGSIIIGNKIAYFKDDTQSLSAQDVIQESFNESSVKVPNFGISSSTHWIKFSVNNKTNEPEIYLEFRQPLIDNITIYDATNEDNIIRIGFGGDNFPFSQREIKHPSYFFTLTIEPGETRTFLASIQSGEQILGFFVLSDKAHTMNYTSLSDTLFGLYAGIILALLFYNLFIYITVREKVYLRYVVYIMFIGLTQISLQGYAFKILSPNHPYIANILPYVFSCLVGISAIYFMREFLNSKTRIPKFHNLSYLFEYLYWITLLIPFFGFYNLAYLLVLALAGSISIYMLTAGVLVYKTGYSPAKYYLLGWSMLLVGIIIYVLKDFSVLPTNFVTSYTMPIGSAVEVILLSFALADRINLLKKEKDASQKAALQSSKEKAQLIEQQREKLKRTVDKKTKDLRIAIKNLKATQITLVEAEKMASLGQLTAGIAHEINNPINFISSNITPLNSNFTDLVEIIECYDKIGKGEKTEEVINEVEALKKNIDYDYLLTEVEEIFGSLKCGTNRVIDIVNSLRTFSSLDESEVKRTNLNLAIMSTITLMRSGINENIKIIEDYDEDLPLVECYPSFLNQALMNIINNAVHSIKDKEAPSEDEQIAIKTKRINNNVEITISDTGIGIPKHLHTKIFEPFFTTRPVGQGTGLGLSVAFKTINKHKGEINIDSKPGEGSRFTVSIPISMSDS